VKYEHEIVDYLVLFYKMNQQAEIMLQHNVAEYNQEVRKINNEDVIILENTSVTFLKEEVEKEIVFLENLDKEHTMGNNKEESELLLRTMAYKREPFTNKNEIKKKQDNAGNG